MDDASPAGPDGQEKQARRFAVECARLLSDDKCGHVVVLDVRGLSQVTDYLVIGSGTSDRQMLSALDHARELGDTMDHPCLRTSADDRATWVLADFADVVVHLFEPATREHYDLEMLWGDAERLMWRRPGDNGAAAADAGEADAGRADTGDAPP